VTARAKKRAAVKAVARGSSDKRAAVLAKKRGMSAAAVALADAGAKKAAAARPAVTKAKASKVAKKGNAVRVAKKVRVAAGLAATKRQALKGGGVANGKKSGGFAEKKKSATPGKAFAGSKAFAPPAGTLRVSIINDLKTPPKPKPGSQRAGARGKVQSAAAQRKMSAERRQASGRGGKLAGARGASLASRLGQARVVKSPAGVAKKSKALGSAFPKGTAIAGKRQTAAGKAAKKRGNAKRR